MAAWPAENGVPSCSPPGPGSHVEEGRGEVVGPAPSHPQCSQSARWAMLPALGMPCPAWLADSTLLVVAPPRWAPPPYINEPLICPAPQRLPGLPGPPPPPPHPTPPHHHHTHTHTPHTHTHTHTHTSTW